MRLGKLHKLFDIGRYMRLAHDFNTPWRALLAASGMLSGKHVLTTRNDEKMIVDRSDLPLWDAYFHGHKCSVEIANGMFHVIPESNVHADYYVKGSGCGFTWMPARHARQVPKLLSELQNRESRVYSQHGEDGVIQAIIEEIPAKHKYVVEFGAYDGVCMSNSRNLIEEHGWNALLIEADSRFYRGLSRLYRDHTRVKTMKCLVTEENINQLFHDAGVPRDFELLSIDVDGPDYYLWKALTDFEPRVVIVEYNSSIDPTIDYVVPKSMMEVLAGTCKEGASLLALCKLAAEKGYVPVYTELHGANVFFIHKDVADKFDTEGVTVESLYQPPQFGVLAGSDAPNGRGYL